MKKVQVPIEDELMFAAKTYAFQHGIKLKDLVTAAIQQYIQYTPTPTPTEQPTQEPEQLDLFDLPPEPIPQEPPIEPEPEPEPVQIPEPEPDLTDYYILRKTHHTSPPLKEYTRFFDGQIEWFIGPECRAHYDSDNQLIPFRFTHWDNSIIEPDREDRNALEQAYGKPVKVER